MKSVISERGQITIPQSIRLQLGLRPGQEIDFEIREGSLIGKKVENKSGIDEVVGILKNLEIDANDYLDSIRGPFSVVRKKNKK